MSMYIALFAVVGLLAIGIYALLIVRNLIKVIVALQILVKAAMLAVVAAGQIAGKPASWPIPGSDRHRGRYDRCGGSACAGSPASQPLWHTGRSCFFNPAEVAHGSDPVDACNWFALGGRT